MNDFTPLVRAVAMMGIKNSPAEPGDYQGDDGMLMCGKCHTPRRKMIDADGNGTMVEVPIPCKCRKEAEEAAEAAKERERQREENAKRLESIKKTSLIDEKFRECTFATCEVIPDNKKQVRLCKSYADRFVEMMEKNQGLLLYGNVGTGKSYLASCIANQVMLQLHSVCATSTVKILKAARDFKEKSQFAALERNMSQADLFLLDDLGAESDSQFASEVIYRVIDDRYRTRRPMIVTTNLTFTQMQNCMSVEQKRVYDRILEVCYPIKFDGKSFRQMKANARYHEMEKFLEG